MPRNDLFLITAAGNGIFLITIIPYYGFLKFCVIVSFTFIRSFIAIYLFILDRCWTFGTLFGYSVVCIFTAFSRTRQKTEIVIDVNFPYNIRII